MLHLTQHTFSHQGHKVNPVSAATNLMFLLVIILILPSASAFRRETYVPGPQLREVPPQHVKHERSDYKSHWRFCELDCSKHVMNPVCGTDNRTYNNACELKSINICQGNTQVKVKYEGECVDKNESHCLRSRTKALKLREETKNDHFVPVCKADGTYASIQCFYSTGYCWCVDSNGTPIDKTSVKFKKPDCSKKEDPTSRERRGRGNKDRKKGKGKGRGRGRKGKKKNKKKRVCALNARTDFNAQVLDLIGADLRAESDNSNDSASTEVRRNKELLEWKFDKLDGNNDNILRKREFKEFRIRLKEQLSKKLCARSLWIFCDKDKDKVLTKEEWVSCFDLNISHKLFLSLNAEADDEASDVNKRRYQNVRNQYRNKASAKRGRNEDKKRDPDDASGYDITFPTQETTSPAFRENCRQKRSQLRSRGRGPDQTYLPECNPNGTFKKVQCHKESRSCWCVDEVNGDLIIGTKVQGRMPNCDQDHSQGHPGQSQAPIVSKGWFKCPVARKSIFQQDLVTFLKKEMMSDSNAPAHVTREQSERLGALARSNVRVEVRATLWKFIHLDMNSDSTLSRRELREFRNSLIEKPGMKLCGKRLQKHCDLDDDQRISELEWKVCVGIEPERKRMGQNPLDRWLKGD